MLWPLVAGVSAAQAATDVVDSAAAAAAAAAPSLGLTAEQAAELAAAGVATGATMVPPGYTPSPMEVGWEIWFGFVAGVVPFIIGSWEFGKRIIIQQRCEVCGGRGLVPSSGAGKDKYLRKCPQCGGFFPWVSWKMFLTSAASPGNGGPLQQPKGQTSVLYSVPERPDPAVLEAARARSQAAIDAAKEGRRGSSAVAESGAEQPVKAGAGGAEGSGDKQ